MIDLLGRLFKRSSTYALGDILTKGAGFLLIPLYTAYLTPDDYGIISLAIVVATIYGIIATGGLNGAILKFYYNFDNNEVRRKFYGTLWMYYILVPGFILILFELNGNLIFEKILPSVEYDPYLRLALWAFYLKSVFFDIPLNVFKARGNAYKYIKLTVSVFVVSTILIITFVVFLKQGAKGFLYAKFLGNLFVAVTISFSLYKIIKLNFRLNSLKKALTYSLPLVPHFLSHWVLSSSDILILEYFVSISEVGIYNVGYTIGSAMSMIAIAGNNSIIPLYGKLDLNDQISVTEVVKTATYYVTAIIFIGLLIAQFAGDFVLFAIPESYHSAISVIPWVVLGYVFMGFYFTQINLLTITLGKTKVVGISTAIAAVLNVGLNILLIPYLGMIGAAITTAFTYLILFLGMLYFSWKAYPLPFELIRMAKLIVAALLIFLICHYSSPDIIYVSILIKIFGVILYPVFLYIFGFYKYQEIQFFKRKFQKLVSK